MKLGLDVKIDDRLAQEYKVSSATIDGRPCVVVTTTEKYGYLAKFKEIPTIIGKKNPKDSIEALIRIENPLHKRLLAPIASFADNHKWAIYSISLAFLTSTYFGYKNKPSIPTIPTMPTTPETIIQTCEPVVTAPSHPWASMLEKAKTADGKDICRLPLLSKRWEFC